MSTRKSKFPISNLFEVVVDELDRSIYKPNILSYVPYPEQEEFHRCEKPGRYVAGGNRGGKTDSIVVEAIFWATDTHPYRTRPESWGHGPIQQRFIVVDVTKGVEQILLPKLKRWVTSSMLIEGSWDKSWDSTNLIFTFSNGSTIDFLTHGMALDKHGGVPRHIIYFDEEPPQPIFNENLVRLMDYDGWWVIAATPVKGIGWTYDLLWEPAENGETDEVGIFTLSAEKNPYLKAENFDRFMIGMSKEEREIRETGKFVARSGLVFPQFSQFSEKYIVDPMIPPKTWDWYSSVDQGFNNPTAWLWHAVSPEGDIITFAEHYASNMVVSEHAAIVKAREEAWGKEPMLRVGDPAMKQHNGVTGTSYLTEYAMKGIYINVEGIPHEVMIGIEKQQQYFRFRPDSLWSKDGEPAPKWVITSNCTNYIRELKKLRWGTYSSEKLVYDLNRKEVVHKKDDHAFDSGRYFATTQPDLTPIPDDSLTGYAKTPTTISYEDMMAKMSEDPEVTFIDEEITQWKTQMSYEEMY